MKKMLFAAVTLSFMLALSACGSGSSSPPPSVLTKILSTQAYDGDIEFDTANVFTVSQGIPPSLLAGNDPVTLSEFRAFLNFPLTGTGGVPGNAVIESATLEIYIDSIQTAGSTIPIRIELVSFPPQTLLAGDFDRIALDFTRIIPPISQADVGHFVPVDVTSLMVEAQRRGLPNFQVRISEDDGFVFRGRIEIDDLTNARAPLLEVRYF